MSDFSDEKKKEKRKRTSAFELKGGVIRRERKIEKVKKRTKKHPSRGEGSSLELCVLDKKICKT